MKLSEHRRGLMMGAVSTLLPKEYQQVEYLRGGLQDGAYIDTEYYPTHNTVVHCDSVSDADCSVFGTHGIREYVDAYGGMFSMTGNGTRSFRWGSQLLNDSGYRCQERAYIIFGKDVYLNGALIHSFEAEEFESTLTILLFRRNLDNDTYYCNIYGFKIYENGKLVRNFIPCYIKSNGVGGMYETVERRFYANKGDSPFEFGGDV